MSLIEQIDKNRLPSHIAIIMDGNGRWAKQKGMHRFYGHQQGVVSVRTVTEACAELGVKYLTLYAFSTENWNRPKEEVDALMEILVKALDEETVTLNKNNIKLNVIGDIDSLPANCIAELLSTLKKTENNTRMELILALSYSSRWEIINAVKNIAKDAKIGNLDIETIDSKTIDEYLCTKGKPDPELLIRTSGEYRISNFLLWQISYSELYFTSKLWPDFGKEELYEAILDFQKRERRFGKTTEQLKKS